MKTFFLMGFKDTVKRAMDSRLAGKMAIAFVADSAIEVYYSNCSEYGYSQDYLVQVESDIRGNNA